jgi:hypothetical protein
MDGTCSRHREDENEYNISAGKPKGKVRYSESLEERIK